MTDPTPTSFLPPKFRILSGSALKVLAMAIMLLDHTAAFLLCKSQAAAAPLFTLGTNSYSLYRIMRDVGRLAFPIFCFLLVEGFLHTRNRRRYAASLFLFACLSEIPWNLAQSGRLFYSQKQNVFFTLFLGCLAFCAIEYFREKELLMLLSMATLFVVSLRLNADYSYRGYVFLLIMYWLRNEKPAQAVIGSGWLFYEWKACFAFLPINMYNGKRGFIRGRWLKYLFYAFYPVHILVIYLIRLYVYHI